MPDCSHQRNISSWTSWIRNTVVSSPAPCRVSGPFGIKLSLLPHPEGLGGAPGRLWVATMNTAPPLSPLRGLSNVSCWPFQGIIWPALGCNEPFSILSGPNMQGTHHLQYHYVGCSQRADAGGGNNKAGGQSGNKDGLKCTSKQLLSCGSACRRHGRVNKQTKTKKKPVSPSGLSTATVVPGLNQAARCV